MPYKSKAQAAYFNANRDKLEEQGVDVDHWNEESRDKQLPNKVKGGPAAGAEPDASQVVEKMKTTPRRRRVAKTASLAEVAQALIGRYKTAMAVLAGKQRLAQTKRADSGQWGRIEQSLGRGSEHRPVDLMQIVPLIQTQPELWEPLPLPLQLAPSQKAQIQARQAVRPNLAESLKRILQLRDQQPVPPIAPPPPALLPRRARTQ